MTSTPARTRSLADRAAELARAEKTSEEIYGSDWWDFTRFLGTLPDNRREVAEVYARAAEILEVSTSYLSTRRALARKMDSRILASRLYYKLPPRVTLEWSSVSGKDAVLDTATAKALIQFEKDGRSLREIYDLLPNRDKPKSWQSAKEREAAETQIREEARAEALSDDEAVLAQLEQKPQLVQRAVREKPTVRRHIVEDTDTRTAIYQEHTELARERTANMDLTHHDDKKNQALQTAEIASDIARLREILNRIRRNLRDHAPDAETRSSYSGALADHGEKVMELVASLRSDAEFEMMMVREGLV